MTATISPVAGLISDKYGRRPLILIIAALSISLSLIMTSIGFGSCKPAPAHCPQRYFQVLPIVMTGFGYVIFENSLYACIPLIVKPTALGTAFGVMSAMMNLGSSVFPTIGSYIHD